MCQKYICARENIDSLGELPYGKGWTLFKEEFNEVFRGLAQLGYAVFYIGHAKKNNITDTSGNIISTQIVPSLSASSREVIAGMSDIYGYAHQKKGSETSVLTLRCPDDSIECGGRFKYIKSEIPMNYNALVETVREAIDKEALEHNNEFITNERSSSVIDKKEEYDFNTMMKQFNEYVSQLMKKEQSNATIITSIVEKYLGKGKKAGDCTPAQCEHLDLILTDLKELLNK